MDEGSPATNYLKDTTIDDGTPATPLDELGTERKTARLAIQTVRGEIRKFELPNTNSPVNAFETSLQCNMDMSGMAGYDSFY